MNIFILGVVVLVLAVSVLLGLAAGWGRQRVSEDYFLAGRSLPWYVVALSTAGAGLGLLYLPGLAGLAYSLGISAAGLAWGNFLAFSLLAWVVLPFAYRKKLYTSGELLERRYSRPTRAIFSALVLVYLIFGVLLPALSAGGWILCEMGLGQTVQGSPGILATCVAAVALVTAAYTVYGGLTAAAWTSALGMLVLLAGGSMLAIMALSGAGGLSAAVQENIAVDPSRTVLLLPHSQPLLPWTGVLAFACTLSIWYFGVNPLVVQRCSGARSEWDARMGAIGGGWLQLLLGAIVAAVGLAALVKLGPPKMTTAWAADRVYFDLARVVLGGKGLWASLGQGLVVAGLLAGVMSVVSGVMNSAATLWCIELGQDLLRQNASEAELIRKGRWTSLVVLLIGAVLAPPLLWWEKGILAYILDVSAVLGPPVAVVFVVGYLWPRAHGRAAASTLVIGVIVGSLMWLAAEASPAAPDWIIPVLNRAGGSGLVSLLVMLTGTVAIPQNPYELYDPDTAWSLDWARLPEEEQSQVSPLGNLVFWWGLLLVATLGLWVAFR